MNCDICDETRAREHNNFVSEYASAISNNSAAIFAGAGLSIPSGELSWASLLSKEAANIGLEIDREDDLISVAQYIYNESGTRNTITKLIKNHVDKKGKINDNHVVLASLPITKYWTTNYDTYIERALEDAGKTVDIKRSSDDLASEIEDAEATIYKMHGDIGQPNAVVLIKDDYEIYDKKNELFMRKLQGDLLSNTFLFVGFSFDDPNLENILSKVRIMLEGNPRRHYCFFKRVSEDDPEFKKFDGDAKTEEVRYRRIKQSLKIKDLIRYGIKSIVVDNYEQITELLQRIRKSYLSNKVFISGSFSEISEETVKLDISTDLIKTPENLCGLLGVRLYENNLQILNCLGMGVGRSLITGVLNRLYEQKKKKLGDKITIRPFPNTENKDLKKKYRTEIISDCGIAIFLYGNKSESGNIINAPGVIEEYEIAKEKNLFIIPIGITGYAAQEIWEAENNCNRANQLYQERYGELFRKINEPGLNNNQICDTVIELINSYKNYLSETI